MAFPLFLLLDGESLDETGASINGMHAGIAILLNRRWSVFIVVGLSGSVYRL